MNAEATMKNKIASLTDGMLREICERMNANNLGTSAETIVLAAALGEYERRFGEQEVDRFMDALGM